MLANNKGGKTRMRILDEIIDNPCNANQLSKKLELDYKTIRYHMKIICKNNYASEETFEKYTHYYPGDKLIKNIDEYYIIKEHIKKLEEEKNEK